MKPITAVQQNTLSRHDVFDILSEEREYQIKIWGLRIDDKAKDIEKSPGDFLAMMQHYINKALNKNATTIGDKETLECMREVVALGIACFEQNGCPRRQIPQIGLINRRNNKPI